MKLFELANEGFKGAFQSHFYNPPDSLLIRKSILKESRKIEQKKLAIIQKKLLKLKEQRSLMRKKVFQD